MEAKIKAKELVDKFDETLTYLESKQKAKQCALITVEEILKITWVDSILSVEEYWQEVKQEIEKL